MRSNFLRNLPTVLVFGAVILAAQAPGSFAGPDEPPAAKNLSGYGCVTAGVEAGCLMLTDTKTQVVYNLYFHGKKPRVGTAIRFSGTPHDGMTMCMQGQAVNVSSWVQLKMKCKPVD
jgi:hypothetical protein